MSAVPLSCFRTQRARPTATARATTLSPRTRGISIVGCGSLEPAARGLVPYSSRDSHADRYDARHVLPVPRVGRVEPERHHTLLELPARSEEHTSELQSRLHLVCRLLLEKKKRFSTAIEPHWTTNHLDPFTSSHISVLTFST